ncbi:MAG: PKD domain-containing protein, partial [Anaerolinea sp.]|nr:PKD domain-containing protein [Anaerolinea sp.]
MRNPRIVVSFCLVFLALLIGAGFAIQAQNDQPVMRIGVLDSERGAISNGARLAVREINASGGITNPQGITMRLELVIEPPTVANQYDDAILRLAQADVDVILGPETTDAVLAALPLLQTLNIPILTPATGDLVIASDSSGLIFRTRAAERWQGIALADYLVSRVNVRQIVSVQLDQSSLGEHIGFQNALLRRPERLERAVLRYNADDGVPALVSDVIERNPQAVVAFGSPRLASRFYTELRAAGWFGVFAYNQATNPIFIRSVPLEALYGVLSTTTWSLDTPSSRTFVNNYLDGYDEAPGAIEAATYDAVYLLAEALRRPGDLRANLASVRDLRGVQGVLNPTGLAQGELSSTVAIIQLNAFGGTDLRLRYAFGQPIEPDVEVTPTATPSPTATPAGVTLTIMSSVQNVRTGPGLQYGVIGQMRQGETARVIGAAADFSWVVINFRGQQGWLATYLLELTGDLRSVPIIPAPPLPTPTPTSTPQPGPIFIVIQSPLPGNLVAGNVGIYGSALHPQFLQYQLDFSPLPNTSGIWTPIAISQTPILNGILGTWNTTLVPDGVYQIRLSVILRDGLVLSTIVSNIRVQNRVATPIPTATPIIPAPVAAFTPDRAGGEAPLTVRFNNQSTGNISRIQWNFGDGTTSTETSPTHTFTTPGIYTVTLEVSGPGGTSNFSWQINVRTISAPSAGFSLSTASGRAPLTVQFSDQSVGNITSWLWNFGDGTTSTERSPSHTFTNVGTYNVFLTVTGPGGTSIASRQVVVENPVSPPPIALFSAQPNSGTAPLTVQFSNQSTGSISGYTWNFGDGSLSSETNPVHTFTVPGTYTVTLYASGPGGSSTAQVIIMASAPTATPTATFTATIISQPVEETATPIPPTATPTETPLPPTATF